MCKHTLISFFGHLFSHCEIVGITTHWPQKIISLNTDFSIKWEFRGEMEFPEQFICKHQEIQLVILIITVLLKQVILFIARLLLNLMISE